MINLKVNRRKRTKVVDVQKQSNLQKRQLQQVYRFFFSQEFILFNFIGNELILRFYSFVTAENNDKIESSEVEPEPENPKVYIDAPPPKENPWLKNKPQLSEPEGKVSL